MGAKTNQIVGFAHGCFWSKEYFWQQVPGVINTRVGFAGGHTTNPGYKEVCTKTTGHAETVEVTFDPSRVTLEELLNTFFGTHDATIDRKGNGGQYRSAFFFTTNQQKEIAQHYFDRLHRQGLEISTEINPLGTFWQAEEKHQGYCAVRGRVPSIKGKTPIKENAAMNYQPINCDFYDYLEIAAMRKTPVIIELDEAIAGFATFEGIIENLIAENGVEFMLLGDGSKVRLDAIVTFNGKPLPTAC